jgi:hypothetical protein
MDPAIEERFERIQPIPAKDERTIDEMADDYTKRFLASLNRSRAAEEEKDSK